MKRQLPISLFAAAFLAAGCNDNDAFPVLRGPYLGQTPPGMTPEMFAPGIISTGFDERIAAFTPDGKELYYALWGDPHGVILRVKEVNGRWTEPEVAPFSGQYEGDFTMSSSGNRIVFSSNMPFTGRGMPLDNHYCWLVDRTENGWGESRPFGPMINSSESFAGFPTIADNGNLFFYSDRTGGMGGEDIWISLFADGDYQEPGNLGDSVNTDDYELDPFVAPDESYILFSRIDKQRQGGADLFVSFRNNDGSWTKAENMGSGINSAGWEFCPTVSPDGKYLFFTSTRRLHEPYSDTPLSYEEKLKILRGPGNGSEDIYWVDAEVIQVLKPRDLRNNHDP